MLLGFLRFFFIVLCRLYEHVIGLESETKSTPAGVTHCLKHMIWS